MDYSTLSDFRINCEVLAIFNPDINHMCLSGDNTCFYDCGPTGEGWNQIDILDYCNSPADAWPIIVNNEIALLPSGGFDWVAISGLTLNGYSSYIDRRLDCCIKHSDTNPLRAAMIVFLMMQDH